MRVLISKGDLQEAIAECLQTKSPNANTCVKLAAFYTILEHLYPSAEPEQAYSYADPQSIRQLGESPFYKAIAGRNPEEVWPIIDEVMTALMAVNPRLYEAAMKKLS